MIDVAVSPFRLVQETSPVVDAESDRGYLWRVLVSCVLLSRARGSQVRDVLVAVFARWPSALALAAAERVELEAAIRPLGLFRRRAGHLISLSGLYADGSFSAIDLVSGRVRLPGIGTYARDAVRAFALDELSILPLDYSLLARWWWRQNAPAATSWRDVLAVVGDGKGGHSDACEIEPSCSCGVVAVLRAGAEVDASSFIATSPAPVVDEAAASIELKVPWVTGRRAALVGAVADLLAPIDGEGRARRRRRADELVSEWERAGLLARFEYGYREGLADEVD